MCTYNVHMYSVHVHQSKPVTSIWISFFCSFSSKQEIDWLLTSAVNPSLSVAVDNKRKVLLIESMLNRTMLNGESSRRTGSLLGLSSGKKMCVAGSWLEYSHRKELFCTIHLYVRSLPKQIGWSSSGKTCSSVTPTISTSHSQHNINQYINNSSYMYIYMHLPWESEEVTHVSSNSNNIHHILVLALPFKRTLPLENVKKTSVELQALYTYRVNVYYEGINNQPKLTSICFKVSIAYQTHTVFPQI